MDLEYYYGGTEEGIGKLRDLVRPDNSLCMCQYTHTFAIGAILGGGHHYVFTTCLCLLFLLSAPLLACVVCAMHYLCSHQYPFKGGQGSIYCMGGDFSSKHSSFPPLPPPPPQKKNNCNYCNKSYLKIFSICLKL